MQRQWMKDLRERSPRVHCITNYVTAGDVANMVLAAGGSPVMAQGLHEVEDVTSICSSLVLNLGTLEERTIPAMEAAGRKAAGLGLPVILDPVGVTASRFRRQTAIDIIRKTSPSVIRGNEAEIRALNQELRGHEAGNTCGVDSETFGTIESRIETACSLRNLTGAVVVMTGVEDVEAGLRAPVVCMNGAAVYDWDGRLMDEIRLSERQVREILDCCQKEDIIFDFMTDRGSYTTAKEAQFRACFERNVLLPMAEFTYEGVRDRFSFAEEGQLFELGLAFYKISVIHESQEVLGRIKERLSRIQELAVASSFATNLELTHSHAQKGRALALYAASRGVRPDEIMAIGDSENDYSMLSMDIKYTVAMGNAMESIKRIARCQTRSNIQDGVAYAIETLVLTREARAY